MEKFQQQTIMLLQIEVFQILTLPVSFGTLSVSLLLQMEARNAHFLGDINFTN